MKTKSLPEYIKTYFWGDNTTDLDLEKNQQYIVQVILEKGDTRALEWLFSNLGKSSVKNLLPAIKLSKKSANFWDVYFS